MAARPADELSLAHAAMEVDTASNEALVEECLRTSAYVYGESRKHLRAQQPLDLDALLEIKRAAARMNRSFTQYVKRARAREDRLLVELHLLRQASQRDATDRDANRARVYEMLRERGDGTETVLDRAMGAVARLESSIASLSPTGTTSTHGAGMLAAASRARLQRVEEDAPIATGGDSSGSADVAGANPLAVAG